MTGRGDVERGWAVRAAFLLLALGLVLMHHVVGAHQHRAVDPAPVGPVAVGAPSTSAAPTALLHVHHDDGDDAVAMLEHLCLGLLTAAVTLVAVLMFLGIPTTRTGAGSGRRVPRAAPARGPPLPRRLSQLQVLRV